MRLVNLLRLVRTTRMAGGSSTQIETRHYAVGTKLLPEKDDESFVEGDAEKLVKSVCINYLVNAEDHGPPIKADSEYPDWLFALDLEKEKDVEDLDPERDGWKYWLAWKRRQEEQQKRYLILKYKYIDLQPSPSLAKNTVYSKYNY